MSEESSEYPSRSSSTSFLMDEEKQKEIVRILRIAGMSSKFIGSGSIKITKAEVLNMKITEAINLIDYLSEQCPANRFRSARNLYNLTLGLSRIVEFKSGELEKDTKKLLDDMQSMENLTEKKKSSKKITKIEKDNIDLDELSSMEQVRLGPEDNALILSKLFSHNTEDCHLLDDLEPRRRPSSHTTDLLPRFEEDIGVDEEHQEGLHSIQEITNTVNAIIIENGKKKDVTQTPKRKKNSPLEETPTKRKKGSPQSRLRVQISLFGSERQISAGSVRVETEEGLMTSEIGVDNIDEQTGENDQMHETSKSHIEQANIPTWIEDQGLQSVNNVAEKLILPSFEEAELQPVQNANEEVALEAEEDVSLNESSVSRTQRRRRYIQVFDADDQKKISINRDNNINIYTKRIASYLPKKTKKIPAKALLSMPSSKSISWNSEFHTNFEEILLNRQYIHEDTLPEISWNSQFHTNLEEILLNRQFIHEDTLPERNEVSENMVRETSSIPRDIHVNKSLRFSRHTEEFGNDTRNISEKTDRRTEQGQYLMPPPRTPTRARPSMDSIKASTPKSMTAKDTSHFESDNAYGSEFPQPEEVHQPETARERSEPRQITRQPSEARSESSSQCTKSTESTNFTKEMFWRVLDAHFIDDKLIFGELVKPEENTAAEALQCLEWIQIFEQEGKVSVMQESRYGPVIVIRR